MKYVFFLFIFLLSIFANENFEGADYLVITPDSFYNELIPLINHREQQGYKCKMVMTKQIFEELSQGRFSIFAIKKYLQRTQEWRHKPKYVLLAADACENKQGSFPSIPTWIIKTSYDHRTASDFPYVPFNDDDPAFVIGRLPCRSKLQIQTLVEKIIRYETTETGLWQRQIHFIAGEGNFGPVADAFCEFLFKNILQTLMPRHYKISMTYGNPNSPYYYPAKYFPKIVVDRINEGSLFFVYVGHGSWNSFGEIVENNKKFSIFSHKHVPQVHTLLGKPFMISIACSTSYFDHPTATSIGENLLLQPQGPVCFIGSSRISHPYPNALIGKSFLDGIRGREKNIGDLFSFVQKELMQEGKGFLRFTIDNGAKLFAGSDNSELNILRRDQLYLYSILGCPATVIKYPQTMEMKIIQHNTFINVSWQANTNDEYTYHVTIETALGKVDQSKMMKQDNENAIANYNIANNNVLNEVTGTTSQTEKDITISLPDDLLPGEYYCKVALVTPKGLITNYLPFYIKDKENK